jgi:hypothetical protein
VSPTRAQADAGTLAQCRETDTIEEGGTEPMSNWPGLRDDWRKQLSLGSTQDARRGSRSTSMPMTTARSRGAPKQPNWLAYQASPLIPWCTRPMTLEHERPARNPRRFGQPASRQNYLEFLTWQPHAGSSGDARNKTRHGSTLLRQGGNARIPWGRRRGGAVSLTCGARWPTADLATHCPDREPENNRGEDCTSSPRPYASLAIADDRRTACGPLKGI